MQSRPSLEVMWVVPLLTQHVHQSSWKERRGTNACFKDRKSDFPMKLPVVLGNFVPHHKLHQSLPESLAVSGDAQDCLACWHVGSMLLQPSHVNSCGSGRAKHIKHGGSFTYSWSFFAYSQASLLTVP